MNNTNANVSGLIQQAAVALKAGNKAEARGYLDRAIQIDERSEQAWLWMSGVVDTDEERVICLENVLTINPVNQPALNGLAALQRKSGSSAPSSYPAAPAASDWFSSPAAPTSGFQGGATDSFANGPFGQTSDGPHEEEDLNWDGIEEKGTNPSPFDSGFFRRPSPYMPTPADIASMPESDPFGLKRKMATPPPPAPAATPPPTTPPNPPSQRSSASFSEVGSTSPSPAPSPAAPVTSAKPDKKAAAEPQYDWNALDKVDLPASQTALFTTVTSKASSSIMSPAMRMSSIPEELRRTGLDPLLVGSVAALAVLSLISVIWLLHTLTSH